MATGDQNDFFARLKAQIPTSWFKSSPNFDATLQGPAWAMSSIYAQITYAALQTRIATATDGYLDLISNDFFGTTLPRLLNETDGAFRARILANLFVKGPTRANMSAVLKLITGIAPIIFEPSNTSDSGGWAGPTNDNVNITGTPLIYRNDWQGNQLLYATPRTNMILQSQGFTNAAWKPTANGLGSVVGSAGAVPDGTNTAFLLTEDTTTGNHLLLATNALTIAAAGTYTVSAFARAGARSKIALVNTTSSNGFQASFDLSAGTVISSSSVGTGTITSASIQSIGSGWYRCCCVGKLDPSATTLNPRFELLNASASSSYTGDGVSGLYLWGAQIESGTQATSYIPTTTAAVTVTDYTVTSGGLVTCAVPPVASALLTWTGTGTDAVTGAPVSATNQYISTGNGFQTAFQIVTPAFTNTGFYWDTGMGQWGDPLPYQSFVTAYRPIGGAQSLAEWDTYRFMWDAYGAWSDTPVTSTTDAAIIAAVESTRMLGTVVWLQITDLPPDVQPPPDNAIVTIDGYYVVDDNGYLIVHL